MATTFQDLNLKSGFLFAAILQDPENCKTILEIILGKKIPEVSVCAEQSLLYSPETRCIRLDVYADDEAEVAYNLEMQNYGKSKLPKRSRFHLAEIDMTSLKPGNGIFH